MLGSSISTRCTISTASDSPVPTISTVYFVITLNAALPAAVPKTQPSQKQELREPRTPFPGGVLHSARPCNFKIRISCAAPTKPLTGGRRASVPVREMSLGSGRIKDVGQYSKEQQTFGPLGFGTQVCRIMRRAPIVGSSATPGIDRESDSEVHLRAHYVAKPHHGP